VEIWNRVKNGDIKAILGARSALFLPFKELGLIIADEEHDASTSSRILRRVTMQEMQRYTTPPCSMPKFCWALPRPSIESYYNVQTKKYALVELKERYGNLDFPFNRNCRPDKGLIERKSIDIAATKRGD
jgi:primosomal protein N' (replication factor Y)